LDVLTSFRGEAPVLADLAWTRITRWREILNQVFESPSMAGRAGSVEQVEIGFAGSAVPSTAGYLGAWLHRSLPRHPAIRWTPLPHEQLVRGTGRIRSVHLRGNALSVRLNRPPGVDVQIDVDGVPGRLHFPLLTLASVLRDEIAIGGADRVFDESWRLLAGLLPPVNPAAG
jgi:glucose-6-phosphate dehydrogenase assembly protein OpcA